MANLLANICGHPKIFRSKADVIQFSKKLKAKRLLGLPIRVRPKTLRFVRRNP